LWHEIDINTIKKEAPLLADRIAISSSIGLENLTQELANRVKNNNNIKKSNDDIIIKKSNDDIIIKFEKISNQVANSKKIKIFKDIKIYEYVKQILYKCQSERSIKYILDIIKDKKNTNYKLKMFAVILTGTIFSENLKDFFNNKLLDRTKGLLLNIIEDSDSLYDYRLRIASIWVLGIIKDSNKNINKSLIEILNNQKEKYLLRSRAAWAIGEFKNKDSLCLLEYIVRNVNEPFHLRYASLRALDKINIDKLKLICKKLIIDKNDELSKVANDFLKKIK